MSVKSRKKDKWFIPIRGSYLPLNGKGWLTYIPYLAFLSFAYILAAEIDVARVVKVYLVAVQWAFAVFFMTWVARKKS